jgi:hypothetical protein
MDIYIYKMSFGLNLSDTHDTPGIAYASWIA